MKINKGWGHEDIWVSTELYCSKFMHFNKGAKSSMHFHCNKDETWYIQSGQFRVEFIDTNNAQSSSVILNPGDTWHNPPLFPHQVVCLDAGTILEVSTEDRAEDNYRILPGDSQS